MKTVKILCFVAALALVAVAVAPTAEAQCTPSKRFASGANTNSGVVSLGYTYVHVDNDPVTPLGDEIGRFWQSSNATLANNFSGTCPAASFWKVGKNGSDYGMDGSVGATGCTASGCPAGDLTVVVEDWQAGFPPPGIGGHAYFVAWRANETPSLTRFWDYGRTAPHLTVFPFVPFPTAHVASSARTGMTINITMNYVDVDPNFHGVTGPCTGSNPTTCTNNPVPADDVIVSYDLYRFNGPTEPGRDRDLWTFVESVPYVPGGVTLDNVAGGINCPDTINDSFIAVGISFDGGSAGPVPSELVGRATRLECNPDMVDPQPQRPAPAKVRRAGSR
jgi:hypothetical protein